MHRSYRLESVAEYSFDTLFEKLWSFGSERQNTNAKTGFDQTDNRPCSAFKGRCCSSK